MIKVAAIIPSPFKGEGQGGGYIHYNHQPRDQKLKIFSRSLRKNMTDVEKYLWSKLRGEQLGVKFRRQYPVGNYIVDFVCLQKKLIIELDGGQHLQQQVYDRMRDIFLHEEGYTVLRFWNNDVVENLKGVLDVIYAHITPTLTLPLKGEGNKVVEET